MITTDCSLQVFRSVLSGAGTSGEVTEVRTSSIYRLVHPLWARSVGQRGSLRHLHELFLVNGILGLRRQRHVKCHVLAIFSDITQENEVQIQFLSRTAITHSSCSGALVSG